MEAPLTLDHELSHRLRAAKKLQDIFRFVRGYLTRSNLERCGTLTKRPMTITRHGKRVVLFRV